MGPTYYQPGPNYVQYPWEGLGPGIYCDELGHKLTFCPDVHIDQNKGIVHLNDCGRLTIGLREGIGGEVSEY